MLLLVLLVGAAVTPLMDTTATTFVVNVSVNVAGREVANVPVAIPGAGDLGEGRAFYADVKERAARLAAFALRLIASRVRRELGRKPLF